MQNVVNSLFNPRPIRRTLPEYAQVYFDHLFSEYLKVAENITAPSVLEQIERIREKRQEHTLTWDDVYSLDLVILDYLPAEDLVRKAYDMRSKYRSIAGSKDYDAYIASKPPDLTTLQLEAISSPPNAAAVTVDVLRADIRYLLGQFYLYYSLMPYREGLREELTRRARNWTYFFLAFSAIVVALSFRPFFDRLTTTVGVVVFAGVMGGCVSMLQRIQSAPGEGDALYNLAAINNGWIGISLSPLYGAIFAVLLSVLFTAKIVEGQVFPDITTPGDRTVRVSLQPTTNTTTNTTTNATPNAATNPALNVSPVTPPNVNTNPSPSPPPSASPTASPTTSPAANLTPTPVTSPQPTVSPANTQTAQASPPAPSSAAGSSAPTPTPTPPSSGSTADSPSARNSLPFYKYLRETGPVTGKDYALLLIWSFIAGFAERLVPDTLNRLVTKNQSIQGTSS